MRKRATSRGWQRKHTYVEDPLVSIVIPALNEERNIGWVLDRIDTSYRYEVILVVATLEDKTVDAALRHRPDVKVTVQTRRGKGNALLCGFAAATGDILVTLDADGSTDPQEIPLFVEPLLAGADYAKGSRFLEGGGSSDLTRIRSLGNRALNILVNLTFGTSYSDMCYGYNALWASLVPVMGLTVEESDGPVWGDGFEVETLMNARAAQCGAVVAEVPSFEGPRRFGASHLSAVADGWRVLVTIVKERRAWKRLTARDLELVLPTQPGPLDAAPATLLEETAFGG
jgi:glycosyltransferase involved in cell wall biosynthesis